MFLSVSGDSPAEASAEVLLNHASETRVGRVKSGDATPCRNSSTRINQLHVFKLNLT